MKIRIMLLAACALAGAAQGALASPDLAKAKNCMACHAVATKIVGPAYKDVAAKYAKDAGAAERLAQKIQKGSQGVWGPVPMPPNPQVSNDEAATLAKWILAQK
ncbi:c-type cytochrome [uncultured Massilia sp.]|uniref:c-type cytochrome n=1 Tax=uncultured Massilia sp. TaxID=169973 RepID=UPI0026007C9B|nr:c-type cytochrome [uncultured Massilia sp.]